MSHNTIQSLLYFASFFVDFMTKRKLENSFSPWPGIIGFVITGCVTINDRTMMGSGKRAKHIEYVDMKIKNRERLSHLSKHPSWRSYKRFYLWVDYLAHEMDVLDVHYVLDAVVVVSSALEIEIEIEGLVLMELLIWIHKTFWYGNIHTNIMRNLSNSRDFELIMKNKGRME